MMVRHSVICCRSLDNLNLHGRSNQQLEFLGLLFMPVELGGRTARFLRQKGDICASFQYVNDESAMCLFPAIKRSHSGSFIICESAAHKYTNDYYLIQQAMKAAEVMGMDTTRQTVVRIADCILVWLDDLLMMPPKPDDVVEHAAQKALGAEATMTINGESKTFEVH